ncbi:MAG: carboxypeptidase regulatory-like domain-containing protein [Hymenobacter sp.]
MLLLTIALVARPFGAVAQEQVIQGTVKDSKGEPMIGATVRVKGGTGGTAVDANGNFQLSAPATKFDAHCQLHGHDEPGDTTPGQVNPERGNECQRAEPQRRSGNRLRHGPQERPHRLGGFGERGKQLTQVATSDPVQALQGPRGRRRTVTSNSGQPGSGTRIRVRGRGHHQQQPTRCTWWTAS